MRKTQKNLFRTSFFLQGLWVLCIAFCFVSCAHKVVPSSEVEDLKKLTQNASVYLPLEESALQETQAQTQKRKNDYLKKYFSPWHEKPNPKVDEVFWIKPSLLKGVGFSEDLQAYDIQSTQKILESMQLETYPNTNQKAIITSTTAVRAVPSNKPMFNKISGYPFDRWQNSLIFSGTPVLITHTSMDKRWVHIQSGFVYGWVESNTLGVIDSAQAHAIQSHQRYITPISDIFPISNIHGDYIMEGRIGQIFARAASEAKGDFVKFYIYERDERGKAKEILAQAPSKYFQTFPLSFNADLIAQSVNALLGQRYGWGGLLENRDCSAFIRDIFTQYGLHLPRNSKAQVFYGNNAISLKGLKGKEKEAFIIAHATPFKTILWQSGHIMLYIGSFEGKALIAHSVWSVLTGKRYENMLGGVVITTLHPGSEHNSFFARSPVLLDKIEMMSDLSILADKIQGVK